MCTPSNGLSRPVLMLRGLDGTFVSQSFGGDCEGETPLPIPNRAVKPLSADGTWPSRAWESRSPPVLARAAHGRLSIFLHERAAGAHEDQVLWIERSGTLATPCAALRRSARTNTTTSASFPSANPRSHHLAERCIAGVSSATRGLDNCLLQPSPAAMPRPTRLRAQVTLGPGRLDSETCPASPS
jgi:hypothetical protein